MTFVIGVGGIVLIGALYVLLPVFLRTRQRLHGPRIVRCPETWQATEVELDAAHGAAGALLGRSTLRVQECARWKRWPAHRDCDQDCLKNISLDTAQNHGLLTAAKACTAS
jgi:hypothetical protein